MTTDHETDPYTQTMPAAWASSPLGRLPDSIRRVPGTDPDDVREDLLQRPRRAVLSAALLGGIALTPLLGLGAYLFGGGTTVGPAVLVPGESAELLAPTETPPGTMAASGAQAPATEVSVGPGPAVPPPAAGQQGPADVAAPGDATVVVEVPIYPPLPEKPGQQDPEPPDSEPPVLDDPNFKQPEPPKPKPDPPAFLPDLPLAEVPKPDPTIKLPLAPVPNADPTIKLPLIPSPKLNPQPEPPSAGLNPQPEPPKPPPFVVDPVLSKW